LVAVTAEAPASLTARATSSTRDWSGVSLITTGIFTASHTRAVTSRATSGSWPIIEPPCTPGIMAGCGQPKLSSTIGRPQSSMVRQMSTQLCTVLPPALPIRCEP
jgi:hypothetical protein